MTDPINLTNKEKAEKLDNLLRARKRQSPRRQEVTLSKVNEEAALILDEFLKKLRKKSLTSETIVGKQYKKVIDIESAEKETNSDEKISYFECESLEDNIPYADEDDIVIRAISEPPIAQCYSATDNDLQHPKTVNNFTLVKSRSLSPCPSHPREFHLNLRKEVEMPPSLPNYSSFVTNEGTLRVKSSLYPPPPPPPSTPYTGSEQSSMRSSPVLKSHQISDSSTSSPVKCTSDNRISSPVTGTSEQNTSLQVTGSSDKFSPSPISDNFDSNIPSPVTGTSDKSTPSPLSQSEYNEGTARSSSPKKFLSESQMGSSSKTHMKTPTNKVRHRSGSISSADTDAEETDHRKKKSMFKRAKERFSRALTIQKRKKDLNNEIHKNKKETKLRKRNKKSKQMKVELNDGLEFDGHAKEMVDETVANGGLFGTLRRLTWGSIRRKMSGTKTISERRHRENSENVYWQAHAHTSHIVTNAGKTMTAKDFGDNIQADSFDSPKNESNLPSVKKATNLSIEKQTANVKGHGHLDLSSDTDLEMDGSSDKDKATNVPFVKKSEEEKEVIYQKIVDRLVVIGDNFMGDHQNGHSYTESSLGVAGASNSESKSEVESSPDETKLDEIKKTQLTNLQKELTDCLRKKASEIDERLEPEARNAVQRIVQHGISYTSFQREVTHAIGSEVSWSQLSALFHLTQRAVAVAGAGRNVAHQIKEFSLQYIADRYASWIVGKGGWDSMLSDTETDED